MSEFSQFKNFITDSVGNGMTNNKDDLRVIADHLNILGFVGDEDVKKESDFITGFIENGIKAFQRENYLKVDGVMRPRGETENTTLTKSEM